MIRRAPTSRKFAQPKEHDQPIVDTSRMNKGERAAMEVAEAARDQAGHLSFAAELFMGRYRPEMLTPFPRQSDADRQIGDELVGQVSAFLQERLDPDEVDASRSIPPEVLDGLRQLGIFRMKVPVEYGGLGLSQVNYNRVVQTIASYCGSTAVLVSAHQSIGVPQPLKMFGTSEQKSKYFKMICDGALTAFALTESEVGSDPARMTTTAELSADGQWYRLSGEKLWTTNGPIAQLLVVMAQTKPRVIRGREKPQITAFIVETDSPGVEVFQRCDFMGLRAIQNGVIRFNNVRVPAENVLWGEGLGLKLALRTLNTGRLTLPAACAGLGKQCLAIAREWGAEREQWGQAIGRHEAGAAKIASIASTTFAMEAVTWLTSHWADQGRDIRIEAAMAKLYCSEASWQVIDETMQLRGGRGYERADSLAARGEKPWPVERMMRDSRINRIIEGTTDIMRLFIAREALDPHLVLASDLLRPGVSVKRKLRAIGGLLAFYSRWYPARISGRLFAQRHRGMNDLARHARYISRSSNRMAATIFGAMLRHGPKLDKRQVLLAHLMEIGVELFVMSATCAYARSLQPEHNGGGKPAELADIFCRNARQRVEAHFRSARSGAYRSRTRLANQVLDGEFRWIEDGIIPAIRPAGSDHTPT